MGDRFEEGVKRESRRSLKCKHFDGYEFIIIQASQWPPKKNEFLQNLHNKYFTSFETTEGVQRYNGLDWATAET